MIPGPYLIYNCPNCGDQLYNGSIVSGNTFGSMLYSDGMQLADMLPDFPSITRCRKCRTIFWLHKFKPLKKVDFKDHAQLEGIDKARFLYIDDYLKALQEKNYEGEDEEKYIRTRLWWNYNDLARFDNEMEFIDEADEKDYRDNCQRLISLCDPTDDSQRITCAELNRNLGFFDECIKMLEGISPDYDWIAEKIRKECSDRNTKVIQLK